MANHRDDLIGDHLEQFDDFLREHLTFAAVYIQHADALIRQRQRQDQLGACIGQQRVGVYILPGQSTVGVGQRLNSFVSGAPPDKRRAANLNFVILG